MVYASKQGKNKRRRYMYMGLIIQLLLGAIGGNIGGALFKNLSLGTLGNSIAGIVGGGVGGQILQMVLGATGVDAGGGMLANVVGGGVGGIVVMAIVGFIKNAMTTQPHQESHS
jgi:uncharacterized membrane protein YeaQ/YmgE (transglycosylase-associated protein family)